MVLVGDSADAADDRIAEHISAADAPETFSSHWSNIFGECAFLWWLRNGAVRAPNIRLIDPRRADERVEAYDGLRVARPQDRSMMLEAFTHREAGAVFAGGIAAIQSGDGPLFDYVTGLASADSEPEGAIRPAVPNP